MSLSKQQRLFIVLLLLAFAGSVVWGMDRFTELKIERQKRAELAYQGDLSACLPTLAPAAYQTCFDRASARFANNQQLGWAQLYPALYRPLLLLWLGAWLVFKILQWIAKGQ